MKRILVPLDGSPSAERALPYAVGLASATRARLTLMHGRAAGTTTSVPDFDVDAVARTMREAEAVGALTDRCRIDIDAVTHDVHAGRIAESICETARDRQADIIVMSTHGQSGPGRWLYGTVADQVLREASVPVVLISPVCDRDWSEKTPLRILVPLDGSRFAEEVLGPVGALATELQADVFLVGAVSPGGSSTAESAALPTGGSEAALPETRAYLSSVADRWGSTCRIAGLDAAFGRTDTVIDEVTRWRHIDMVAMATHGRIGAARLALGSVASETLQRSTVPLLLVCPPALSRVAEPASTVSA